MYILNTLFRSKDEIEYNPTDESINENDYKIA